MIQAARVPLVVVIAGPNGAGKSTAAPSLLQDAMSVHEFVNADTIALGLSAFRPEQAAVAAGRIMLSRLDTLAKARADFAFETTRSGRGFAPWLRGLRADGYRVHLVFLSLPSAELAIARVRERVRRGGHDIPPEVVRRRYTAGLRNFLGTCRNIADGWQLFDNSDRQGPRLIASGGKGSPESIVDPRVWTAVRESAQ